jgi:hemoglobin-like flavoprotein
MAVTPEQLDRVAATLGSLHEHGDRFAVAFYDRLFELAPEARALFPGDLTEQRGKLVAELTFLAEAVRDLDDLVGRARDLGARHHGYGVRPSHYRIVEQALLAGLVEVLGDGFDTGTESAWRALYWLIAETMMEGAASAVVR